MVMLFLNIVDEIGKNGRFYLMEEVFACLNEGG